jgi:hypothetical protein
MTNEQFRYLVSITRKRADEERFNVLRNGINGDYRDVSFSAGKESAFREMLFLLHGMASDETEDAFK